MRAFHIIHCLSTDAFQDRRISLLLKSIKINRPIAPKITQGLTIETLHQVIAISATLEHNVTFMALYYFIFSFLRLSNLLPHTSKQYDFTRHMARGDIIFSHSRRYKIEQSILYLGSSNVCPIIAFAYSGFRQ